MNKQEYYYGLNYKINIEYNQEDETWTAYHPEFGRGSCYATGENQIEAIKLLAIDRKELIATLLEENIDVPVPILDNELPSGKIPLRIPRSLHGRIKEFASSEGVSVNQFISTQLAFCGGQYKLMQNIKGELTNLMQNITIQRMSQIGEFSEYQNLSLPKRKKRITMDYYKSGAK